MRLLGREARLAIRDRNDLVAVNHQNRPRRLADRQICARKVNELSSKSLRWFSHALDLLPTHEINRNQINRSWLLELYRKSLQIFPPTIKKSRRFAPSTDCLLPGLSIVVVWKELTNRSCGGRI